MIDPIVQRAGARRVPLLVALIGALHACGPRDAEPRIASVYEENFSATCAGVPCGWTQRAGAPGAAHTTATLLPGLRGLALEGDGVLVDGPGAAAPLFGISPTALRVALTARCDADASLTVRVGLTGDGAADGGVDPGAALLEAQLRPPATWPTAPTASAEVTAPLVPGGSPDFRGEARIVSVSLEKRGAGRCEIDALRIDPQVFDTPFFEGGCL